MRKEFRTRCTTQVWPVVSGHTVRAARRPLETVAAGHQHVEVLMV
jgi:hypothetical protein